MKLYLPEDFKAIDYLPIVASKEDYNNFIDSIAPLYSPSMESSSIHLDLIIRTKNTNKVLLHSRVENSLPLIAISTNEFHPDHKGYDKLIATIRDQLFFAFDSQFEEAMPTSFLQPLGVAKIHGSNNYSLVFIILIDDDMISKFRANSADRLSYFEDIKSIDFGMYSDYVKEVVQPLLVITKGEDL